MQRIRFYVGENKHVRIRIHARNNEPFVIREATWQLKGDYDTEAEGECLITGDVIDAMIMPQKRTTYKLYFTYKVADNGRYLYPVRDDHAKSRGREWQGKDCS